MTRDEIEKLSDEELNVMVATEVMEWKLNENFGHYWDLSKPDSTMWIEVSDFLPASDIAAAWQVVEKMQGFDMEYSYGGSTLASALFAGGEWCSTHADTAPLAICRAALLAKMRP